MNSTRRQAVMRLFAVALTCVVVEPASAQTRDDLIDAFYELRDQTRAAYKGGIREVTIVKKRGATGKLIALTDRSAITKFKGVELKNSTAGKVKQMIKVWGVPVNSDGVESERKVNLDIYKWRPAEKFHLYFETAVPINVSIYQDYPDRPSEHRFPDKAFADTFNVIPPGRPVRYPVRIVLDETNEDELMTVIVDTAGSTGLPVIGNAAKLAEEEFLVFSKNFKIKKVSETKPLTKFRAERDDTMESTTGNPDNVASFMYGTDSSGRMQLRLQKRRE